MRKRNIDRMRIFNLMRNVVSCLIHYKTTYATLYVRWRLKRCGANIGNHLMAYWHKPRIIIKKGYKSIIIGERFLINNNWNTSWFCKSFIYVGNGASLKIGNNSGINGALIYCSNSITIGNYVKIGGGTRIYDTNFHTLDYMKRRTDAEKSSTAPIVIEDDVFIGTSCIIGKGVTIGARSVIGAGSVVTKSIPPDCIAAGNPARVIRNLESDH